MYRKSSMVNNNNQHNNSNFNIQTKNKSLDINMRSRSKSLNKSNYNKNLPHSCKDSKLFNQLLLTQQKLIKNRAKLTTCLQIYSILQSGQQKQRCLIHNNTLSLYCLNQRRVLCVNCIYGVHKHRTHKVLPLKDCIPQIQNDNKQLKILIENQLRRLQIYAKTANDNKVILQTQLSRAIKNIQKTYGDKIKYINECYENAKMQIQQLYEPLIQKLDNNQKMFQDFKFRIWEGVTKFGDRAFNDEAQIVKQIFYVSIAQLCQVKNRPITQKQIQTLARKSKIIL